MEAIRNVACLQGITHTGAQDTFRYNNPSGGLTELILDGYSDMRNLNPLKLLGSLRSFSMRNCLCQDPWLDSFVYLTQLTALCLSANPGVAPSISYLSALFYRVTSLCTM